MKNIAIFAGVLLGASALATLAMAQSIFPQYTALTGNEIVQDVGNPTSAFFKTSLQAALTGSYEGAVQSNALIGGDAGDNLFSYGSSVTGITTGPTFGADRWFGWSGTNTGFTIEKDTTAGQFPATTNAAFEVLRTGSGVVQVCVGQDVSTANSVRFAGQTAEFDFHAIAQSGFSAASSQLQPYVVYGTGTNEGANKMAYTINAGGSAGSGWANGKIAANPLVTISSTLERVTVAAAIPATVSTSPVTEVGVALCWTPVGASPSSDGFAFSLAQLVVNPALSNYAGQAKINASGLAKSFVRSLAAFDALAQLSYHYQINEAASGSAGAAAIFGTCQGTATSTVANCNIVFPVPMFQVPTISYTAGTIKATVGSAAAPEAVSALVIPTDGATIYGSQLTATSSSVSSGAFGYLEAGDSTGGGVISFSAEP